MKSCLECDSFIVCNSRHGRITSKTTKPNRDQAFQAYATGDRRTHDEFWQNVAKGCPQYHKSRVWKHPREQGQEMARTDILTMTETGETEP